MNKFVISKNFLIVLATVIYLIGARGNLYANTISADIRLTLDVPVTELPEFKATILRFAENEGFSFKDTDEKESPDGKTIIYLQLYKDDFIQITVSNVFKENRVLLGIYKIKYNPLYQDYVTKLETDIRKKWPSIAPYTGP